MSWDEQDNRNWMGQDMKRALRITELKYSIIQDEYDRVVATNVHPEMIHLFKAAPDMLEALETLVKAMQAGALTNEDGQSSGYLQEFDELIDKAKGIIPNS